MPEEVSEEGHVDSMSNKGSQKSQIVSSEEAPADVNSPQTNANFLKKVKNPAMTDNMRTYKEISSTFNSMHDNQALFLDGPNADLLSPILQNSRKAAHNKVGNGGKRQ